MNIEKKIDLIAETNKLDALLSAVELMVGGTAASKLNTPENCRFIEMIYMVVDQMAVVKGIMDSTKTEREVR